jgi:hypothetical protein
MRRLLGLLFVFSVVLGTGCGGGEETTGSDSVSAETTATESSPPPSEAEARAFAEAVNLKASDISLVDLEVTAPEKDSESEDFIDCLGVEPTELASIESEELRSTASQEEILQLSSEVSVFPTASEAMEALELFDSDDGRRCIEALLENGDLEGEARFGNVRTSDLPLFEPSNEIGIKAESAVIVGDGDATQSLPFFLNARGFTEGPAVVFALTIRTSEPPEEGIEKEAMASVRGRAEMYSLEGGVTPPSTGGAATGAETPRGTSSTPSEWTERWCEVEIGDSREEATATMGTYPTEEDSGKIPHIPEIELNDQGENVNEGPPLPLGSDTWEAAGTYQFNAFFDTNERMQQLDFAGPESEIDCAVTRIR